VDPYQILQVDRTAEPDVIRAAYRTLARRHHPDMGGDLARMAELNEAWGILGDTLRRARYDRAADRERAVAAARAASSATGCVHGTPVMRPDPVGMPRPARPAPSSRPATTPAAQPTWSHAPSPDRAGATRGEGTVLDFGRYIGWSIGELGRHDPDYLMWLERTPAGRPLRGEIQQALERQQSSVATMSRPLATSRTRRSWFR
jgi:curved DNA-binding protein CbpA